MHEIFVPQRSELPPRIAQLQNYLVRMTQSTVTVALDGTCLRQTDYQRGEFEDAVGRRVQLCARAGRENAAIFGIGDDGSNAWAVPVEQFVVMISSGAAEEREKNYLSILKAMLPQIATITNGEAILFDEFGTLAHTSLPNGRPSPNAETQHEELAELLISGMPEIARSRWVPGATAVRLPITRTMGLAFNNALSVQVGREIADDLTRPRARYTWDSIVSHSENMKQVLTQGRLAASSDAPVLIYGESGTGKELLAQAIHNSSPRAGQAFVSVNCGALTPSLIESLLFGYVAGAFTGAKKGGQKGLFERAHRGTLLLDEISELDLDLQVKLLRVIQEEEVMPVGGHTPRRIDVRIVCTSNRDLMQMVREGKFRHDLYYRLNVLDVSVPPLRERAGDIPLLTRHLLASIAERNRTPAPTISEAAMESVCSYHWPGNIRELQNALERASTIAQGNAIQPHHLPAAIHAQRNLTATSIPPLADWLREARTKAARSALEAARGNKSKAAEMLQVSNTTFWRLLND